jgi:hypothetical protein
LTNS